MMLDVLVNPLVPRDTPDPCVVRHRGNYCLTATHHPLADRIVVWRAPTLSGFRSPGVDRAVVWSAPPAGPQSKDVWAPELHQVEGRWYLHFCASDGVDANHRQYVLEAETDDPLGPWSDRGRADPEHEHFAIDGTVLELLDRTRWFVWSDGGLWIAPMMSSTRVHHDGPRVRIAAATLPWEGGWLEAPQPLVRADRVWLAYSAGHSATPDYRVGLLELGGDDPLNPLAWRKSPHPLLEPYPPARVWTTGHCSFTRSPDDSEDWIVYHAKDTTEPGFGGRTARAQRLMWAPDGTPFVGRPVPLGVSVDPPSGK